MQSPAINQVVWYQCVSSVPTNDRLFRVRGLFAIMNLIKSREEHQHQVSRGAASFKWEEAHLAVVTAMVLTVCFRKCCPATADPVDGRTAVKILIWRSIIWPVSTYQITTCPSGQPRPRKLERNNPHSPLSATDKTFEFHLGDGQLCLVAWHTRRLYTLLINISMELPVMDWR